MANIITNILSIKELRNKLLFTIFILAVFRIGAQVPTPGIDPVELLKIFGDGGANEGILGLLNLFSGGALGRFSLFALGIMPYISSSIIMQLLKVVIPTLDRLSKEGSYGQKKIELYTKYGTLALCIVQSIGLIFLFKAQVLNQTNGHLAVPGVEPGGDLPLSFMLTFVLTMTTGTMFLLWLGERITERGLGNGVSLLIFAGIVARLPQSVGQLYTSVQDQPGSIFMLIIVLAIFGVVIGLVVAEQQATRKIPVQYAKRVVGNRMYGAQSTHIPFKINPSGVIPIIFASSVIIFPTQLMGLFGSGNKVIESITNSLSPGNAAYVVLYMLLVIFFAYFYTAIYFNPVEISDRLKKEGGFIPGIRPGNNTSAYLSKVLNRITLPGSIFLGLVAVFPDLIVNLFKSMNSQLAIPQSFAYLMGGTSLLIMVGVGLDTARQVESHLLTRNMGGILKKTKLKGRR